MQTVDLLQWDTEALRRSGNRAKANRFRRSHPDKARAACARGHARKLAREPRYQHGRNIWRDFRLSLDDWDRMLLEQAGRCAMCGEPLRLAMVDHDHATGRVRGLLDTRCNAGLGYVESPGFVDRARAYLAERS